MKKFIKRIMKENPLCHEYETDARDVWPNRWKVLTEFLTNNTGYYIEDNEGNKYIISEDLIQDFDRQTEYLDGWSYDEWDEVNQGVPNPFGSFEEYFGKYSVEGDLYDMKIIMEDK